MTMRKGQGSSSEAEFSVLLDEIVALIGYTPDRDVFRAFYTSGLAKRLLLNKSASDDMERTMIVKLQKGGQPCRLFANSGRDGRGVHYWRHHVEGPSALRDVSWQAAAQLTPGSSRRTSRRGPRTPPSSKTAQILPPTCSPNLLGHREWEGRPR